MMDKEDFWQCDCCMENVGTPPWGPTLSYLYCEDSLKIWRWPKKCRRPQNEDNTKTEDNPRKEGNLKNKGSPKIEENLKNKEQ